MAGVIHLAFLTEEPDCLSTRLIQADIGNILVIVHEALETSLHEGRTILINYIMQWAKFIT